MSEQSYTAQQAADPQTPAQVLADLATPGKPASARVRRAVYTAAAMVAAAVLLTDWRNQDGSNQ